MQKITTFIQFVHCQHQVVYCQVTLRSSSTPLFMDIQRASRELNKSVAIIIQELSPQCVFEKLAVTELKYKILFFWKEFIALYAIQLIILMQQVALHSAFQWELLASKLLESI